MTEESKKTIDVNKLTAQQADAISEQLGKEIAKIMDEANEKCDKLLGVYGLQTRIGYDIIKKTDTEKGQALISQKTRE